MNNFKALLLVGVLFLSVGSVAGKTRCSDGDAATGDLAARSEPVVQTGIVRQTYRAGKRVARETKRGTTSVSKKAWRGTKKTSRKSWKTSRKVVSRTKKVVY